LRESEDRWPAREVFSLDINDPLVCSELKKSECDVITSDALSGKRKRVPFPLLRSWESVERCAALVGKFLQSFASKHFPKAGVEKIFETFLRCKQLNWRKLGQKKVEVEVTSRDKTVRKLLIFKAMQKSSFLREFSEVSR
jgi:hypothetical protein